MKIMLLLYKKKLVFILPVLGWWLVGFVLINVQSVIINILFNVLLCLYLQDNSQVNTQQLDSTVDYKEGQVNRSMWDIHFDSDTDELNSQKRQEQKTVEQ